MKNWLRKYFVPIVIGGVSFSLIILVDIFRSEWWARPVFDLLSRQAIILSVAAAVTLAAAAVWAVRTSADQTRIMINENRHIRAEDRESDFKRRCLDHIRNWTLNCVPLLSEDVRLGSPHSVELLRNRLEPSHAEREGMFTASIAFNVDFRNVVFNAVSKLEMYFDQVSKMAEGVLALDVTQRRRLMETKEEARQSFTDLLESVTELSMQLQL